MIRYPLQAQVSVSALGLPYKVETDPTTILVNQEFEIRVYCRVLTDWIIYYPNGAAYRQKYTRAGGAYWRDEDNIIDDNINLSGSSSNPFQINTTYPITNRPHIRAKTYILDYNTGKVIESKGSVLQSCAGYTIEYKGGRGGVYIKDNEDRAWFGTVSCQYTKSGYVYWKDTHTEAGTYLYLIHGPENIKTALTVTVNEADDATVEPAAVEIEVLDLCTGQPIEDMEIFVDSVSKGTTDANGKLYIGVQQGGSHGLNGVKTGYVEFNDDLIDSNDTFVV